MRMFPRNGSLGRSLGRKVRFHRWLALWLQKRRRKRAVPAPAAPENLMVAVNPADIELSWDDLSDNETGFRVYRRPWSDPFAVLATTAANVSIYNDWSAELGVVYSYYVVAVNGTVESAPSNIVLASIQGG